MKHLLLALAAVVLALALRSDVQAEARPQIVIGSKNFAESRLLAEIMAQLVEGHLDVDVVRKPNLGGTTLVFAALRSGDIDLYPEYTGTAYAVLLGHTEPVSDPLQVYLRVDREYAQQWELDWLEPFGFTNGYALAMPRARAEELGVTRISDLAAHGDAVVAGVSHEFLERPDGWGRLVEAYDLHIADVRGMEHGLAYQAVAEGKVDLIDTYTTDGKLARHPVLLLEDDLHFFPPYDAAPVVRRDTLARVPELEPLLQRLAFSLDDARMQQLNHAVEHEGRSFTAVAREFLDDAHLLDDAVRDPTTVEADRSDFAAFAWSQRSQLLGLVGQHLLLTLSAVVLAILVAVPVGIVLTRRKRWAELVIGATGVIQTIPSLALLAFMIPLPGLGLGARSAVAALFLYALLPIVRNTYAGITEVDRSLIEAARGMGLTDRQMLTRVELPLAVRTIMAGVRTSTVISIGVATLAAFIGGGGLGDPIVTGLQLDDTRLILLGAIPAALLAVLTDVALARVERRLQPRGVG
jgi:osmoprotectant transport system permease protein